MARLQIVVGDLHFSARWEAAAPRTIEAIRRMLPIEASLIHCRWSGESTWIPYGDLRPGIDYENHTSHPAPGQLALYPGGISECEIFFPYGACTTSSKVGQLAANHFATIEPDDGWDDRLREVGRRCLWQGAQAIRISEVVAVEDGRISAIEPDLASLAESALTVVDATGLLVLPGIVDVHTHTRVASDAEPDRFFQDSVAAAFGGTTTFLAFNNPGTGSSPAAERSLVAGLSEWRAATASDAAVDYAVSLAISGHMDDPVGELAAIVDAGVPTAKAFMVFDFRLDNERLFEAIRTMGRRGGRLEVHCEDPVLIDTAVADALARGNTAPRFHASSRPALAEAVATARTMAFAEAADAPVHVVHLSSFGALEAVRAARARGVRVSAETCPHYLTLTDARYLDPDDAEVAKVVISPPLRSAADREALWTGLSDGSLDLVATDHVPDRVAVEKRIAGVPFNKMSNGAPGIETLLAIAWSEGVATGRISPERLIELLSAAPARLFGLGSKGILERGRDADLVLFDPSASRTIRAADLHHTSDYTAFEGLPVSGAVRSVFVRGRAVIRDGLFVGQRGYGRFVERRLTD